MDVARTLLDLGGVASRATPIRCGFSAYALGKAVETGDVGRVRQGWYASPAARVDVVRAVRVGGALTCVSVLEGTGIWPRPDPRLHVSVASNSSRLRSPDRADFALDKKRDDVVIHWNRVPRAIEHPRDGVAAAIAHMSTCQPIEWTLVALDSALNLKLVTASQLRAAFARFPEKSRAILGLTDAKSQSGLETLARYRLRRFGIRHRTQVAIAGVGRVDVVVGERLVLELDGRGFHSAPDAFEADRRRDLALHSLGYRVLRLSYRQVMHDWTTAERVIRTMVRRGDHLWPRRRLDRNSG